MIPISRYIPSMFQRRVLLLGSAAVVAFIALGGRLAWMTSVMGEEYRAKASQRLVTETWLPTVRGTVFDRKGRVLAGDRASYDIAVDYRVLAGQWVYNDRAGQPRGIDMRTYATRLARRANPDVWDELGADRQAGIVDRFESALRARVQGMFEYIAAGRPILAVVRGTPLDELMERRAEILSRVGAMKAEYTQRTREREIEKHERRGYVPEQSDLDRIERIAAQPIAEEVRPHTLVANVSDDVGFTVLRQRARTAPIVTRSGQRGAMSESEINALLEPVLPGLSVVDATTRMYPYDTIPVRIDRSSFPPPLRADEFVMLEQRDVGSMLLGSVRGGLQAEDVQRRAQALQDDDQLRARVTTERGTDRGRYFNEDRVGRSGIERAYEDHLRGLRGVSVENLQSGAVSEIGSTPGLDLQLTLDIMLQARIRAILDPVLGLTRVQPWHQNEEPLYTPVGTELDAGVIVLEVASGEILAMVSTPVPPGDGDWASLGIRTDEQYRRYNAIHSPWINKAIGKPYPPGSVSKAIMLTEAAKRGFYSPSERIEATGHLLPGQPDKFRSWIYKQNPGVTHFDQLGRHPDGVDALMVSSNVFFFTLGRRMGPTEIAAAYRDYGVGTPFDLGVGDEWAGSVGALSGPNDGSDLNLDDATLMGIGQGPVTWTPLHAADAFATLARQGYRIAPQLVRDGRAPQVEDLGLPSWAVRDALAGLKEVVTNVRYGTGRAIRYEDLGTEPVPIFNAPGVSVWGKTGTATAPAVVYDPDRVGDENGPLEPVVVRKGDHSWFVTLVGPEGGSPEYAIAVIVDYAGSGGRVSGPINNQIIHALIEEGYLPRAGVQGGPFVGQGTRTGTDGEEGP
ncbi:MAG: penicillin-binding transpeptidase domain-containing protein [Phycisphaerales bacterium]